MQGETQRFASRLTRGDSGDRSRWDPPFCGDIDMRIAADGSWHYQGSRIARQSLVRLFASVLWREDDGGHYLVTPVEKFRIRVDDAPLVVVAFDTRGEGAARRVRLTTNIGEIFEVSAEHPVFTRPRPADGRGAPYLACDRGLVALVSRPVYYELAGLCEPVGDGAVVGFHSGGDFIDPGFMEMGDG